MFTAVNLVLCESLHLVISRNVWTDIRLKVSHQHKVNPVLALLQLIAAHRKLTVLLVPNYKEQIIIPRSPGDLC